MAVLGMRRRSVSARVPCHVLTWPVNTVAALGCLHTTRDPIRLRGLLHCASDLRLNSVQTWMRNPDVRDAI
jgi:hypothetical protein